MSECEMHYIHIYSILFQLCTLHTDIEHVENNLNRADQYRGWINIEP